MKNDKQLRKEMNNVKTETDSSAVLNDVIASEFEQHPGQNEELTKNHPLTAEQEITQNNTDGKTWMHTEEG
ncbi:hypothetical protein ERJ70_16610 [Sediminibacillus dalangtanensis]|uniref:DUF4025 domain-containing protein n=1 Tax=Sediminibacillus dalangtanensis TaxID=2729421 RepID=A0ABX7VVN6_9BACI|nr:hypothetical protein [Sediminibacillus dalangtanensis]QTN00757.1 hypothetical protein ERJ70_16610 [Sediminibacillus dalangtanensis]